MASETLPPLRPPPSELMRPLSVPQRTLLGPGPSNCPPRVLAACALPILGHLHPEFVQVMEEIKGGLQYMFQTQNKATFAVSGTGHAGMEVALANLVEPKDVVLVACNGLWGERASSVVERNGGIARCIYKEQGHVFSMSDVEKALKEHHPSVFFITQGESSTTTLQPIMGLGELCHRYNCVLVVDAVASLGGVPFFMDEWAVDCVYSGSQKVLSSPPGAAPCSFSPLAWRKIEARKTKVTSFYFDAVELGLYWNFGTDADPNARKYHHTAQISTFYGLREGLALACEEGLEKLWARHARNAERLWEGVERMGLEMLHSNKEYRLPTVNAIKVPDGVNWKEVVMYAMKNYDVEFSGGLGPSAGKVWRIGFMGYNSTPENVDLALRVLKEAIDKCRSFPPSTL